MSLCDETCSSNLFTFIKFKKILEQHKTLSMIDVIVSMATTAITAPISWCRPKMRPVGYGSVIMKGARHPCIEAQNDITYIPNDVEMTRGKVYKFEIYVYLTVSITIL